MPPGVVLRSNERLLWAGKPFQGFFAFEKYDAVLIPFTLMWAGFAVFWNATVWLSDGPVFFRLWGVPFLVVGSYVTVGRFVHNKISRSAMSYALTDQRAIFVAGNGKKVRERPLAANAGFETSVRSDGSGTIDFDPTGNPVLAAMGSMSASLDLWRGPAASKATFYRIDEVQRVVGLVQDVIYGVQDVSSETQPPPTSSPNALPGS